MRAEAQAVLIDAAASGEITTAVRLRNELRPRLEDRRQEAPQDFLAYARELISSIREGRIATARGYSVAIGKLVGYADEHLGEKCLPFSEIMPSFIGGFRRKCIEEHENTVNSANKNVRIIRTLYYRAIKDGLVSQESNPFFTVRLKDKKVQKDCVTYEEVKKIEQLGLKPGSLIWHVRKYFLFASYAGGMRWSDVALLKRKHVAGGRTRYEMRKTKDGAGVPLLPQAQEKSWSAM